MANDLFEKNLNSFKPKQQAVAAFFKNIYQMNHEIEVGIEIIEDRKILYAKKSDMVYQLDSVYESSTFVDMWFEQLENRNYRSRYLIFGLGNGMYVKKLLSEIEEGAVIIIVEPSIDILYKALCEKDLSGILSSEQVHLIVDSVSEERLRDLLGDYLTLEDLPGVILRSYLNYSHMFSEKYDEFEKTFRFYCNVLNANSTYYERFGSRLFYNFFHNYEYMAKGKSLINLNLLLPKDIPAILVCSGPSLDKNVELLKKAKNKSFILAVDSAARVLARNGVRPDMIMTIDPGKMFEHIESDLLKDVPMICTMRSYALILGIHKGDKYFLHDENPYIEAIFNGFNKILPLLSGGGSVATDAFGILEGLQFKTIVLVGQDLAYTNGKTHSKQSVRGEWKEEIKEEDCLWVEGQNGEKILTSLEFQIYQDWLEEEIKNHPQYKVIDATEGGAKIEGTIIKTLSDVIMEECIKEINMEKILSQVVYRLEQDEQEVFLEAIRKLPKLYEKIEIEVDKLIVKTEKMILLTMAEKYHNKEMKKLYAETSKMVKKMENLPEYYLIDILIRYEVAEGTRDVYAEGENKKDELLKSLNESLRIYHIIKRHLSGPRGCMVLSKLFIEGEQNKEKWFLDMPDEVRKLLI